MLEERIGRPLPMPKIRAIQVIAKKARETTGPVFTDPWQLGIQLPEIPPDATGDLLAVWKLSRKLDKRFTIRQAVA